jgi:hypothetical protein
MKIITPNQIATLRNVMSFFVSFADHQVLPPAAVTREIFNPDRMAFPGYFSFDEC